MKIRTNKIMDEYLVAIQYDFQTTQISLPAALERLLQSDFLTNNDCVTLKELYNNHSNPTLKTAMEKSEWEYNETHFHPSDYSNNQELDYLSFALEAAKRIKLRLKQHFPETNFRILVSFSETEIKDGQIESYSSSTVRFYQVRPDCEEKMRIENLNDYKSEAILEIELWD